jgi:hypothetical protein
MDDVTEANFASGQQEALSDSKPVAETVDNDKTPPFWVRNFESIQVLTLSLIFTIGAQVQVSGDEARLDFGAAVVLMKFHLALVAAVPAYFSVPLYFDYKKSPRIMSLIWNFQKLVLKMGFVTLSMVAILTMIRGYFGFYWDLPIIGLLTATFIWLLGGVLSRFHQNQKNRKWIVSVLIVAIFCFTYVFYNYYPYFVLTDPMLKAVYYLSAAFCLFLLFKSTHKRDIRFIPTESSS